MTEPIEIAYVELRARGEKDTARDIKKMLTDIQRNTEKLSKEVEKSFSEAGRDIERELTEAGSTLTKEATRQRHEWRKVADSLALDMKTGATAAAAAVDDMADKVTRDLRRVMVSAAEAGAAVATTGRTRGVVRMPQVGGDHRMRGREAGGLSGITNALGDLGQLLGTAMRRVRDLVSELSDSLGNAAAKAAQGLAAIGGAISAILGPIGSAIAGLGMLGLALVLSPFLVPLIAALSQLSGLLLMLPGTIGVLVAVIAPLIMAFSGLGDAVSALASGNLEKIEAAMKKLSPAAQRFAREINAIREPLHQLKMLVQERFFGQFQGELTKLVNGALPTLRTGLGTVSTALGRMTGQLIKLFQDNDVLKTIGDVFASTGRIIDRVGPSFVNALGAIISAVDHAMPFIERFFSAMGDGMNKFADWLSRAMRTGDFERWLDNAFKIAKDLWDLFKALGELIGAVFGGLGDEGDSMLQSITKTVKKLTEFFKSPEGKKFLSDIANGAVDVANAMVTLAGAISDVSRFFARVEQKMNAFSAAVREAAGMVKSFFNSLWQGVKNVAGDVSSFFGKIGNWFKDVGSSIRQHGGQIVTWFQELPGKITSALQELPGKISDFFSRMLNGALYAIGFGLGSITKFFLELPGRISSALTTLWNTIQTWFNNIRTTIVTTATNAINTVVTFFQELPGRVGDAARSLVDRVRDLFTRTRDQATETTSNIINTVVSFFQRLPGRVMDAIHALPGRILDFLRGIVKGAREIGGDIMDGIARGIRNGWNSAINAAKDAARQVLKGFWDAFEIGSPSRLAARTVGVPVMQGIGVGVLDAVPQLRDMINKAIGNVMPGVTSASNDQSVTFGPGAVQVVFEGAVPTAQEALQTGMTVGAGVARTLARRNVRTTVRTI